ncbi:hypothetical protein VAR608DRAFT_5152 [Variovorax sp. HW608]|uniref:zinc ribbon domain-containing protein n=1 Tax=Variovorax sp. HW608 TaxID=1034889 RepID=UPI00081F8E3E|nr:zinc ribbon domain-containing protein [Variovorax sp. HW608]SCK51274.1 hypothetical protein VAR608DRAFT_5152 [Variovorax sp. HW608]
MPVICPACQTENRDSAMFCHGCARKLPTFTATQPSMLETMRAMPARPVASTAAVATPVQIEPRSLIGVWIGIGVAAFVLLAGIGTWYASLLRKPPPSAASATVASRVERPASAASSLAVAADQHTASVPAPETVSLGASLAPGEAAVTPGGNAAPTDGPAIPPAAVSPPVAALTPSPPPAERRQVPKAAPPTRVGALDPRSGCETLNFVFAARCEAAHCDKPQYAQHPRCNLVRAQRKRDELHRNPTLAF